jgi:glycosyltransferase involved in cell wall biosynthesis
MLTGKRILLVHSSAGLYGADRCLLSITKGLNVSGARVHVVLPYDGVLADKLKRVGARIHYLDPFVFRRDILKPAGAVKLIFKAPHSVLVLTRLIKHEGIELVYTNTGVVLGGALAARIAGVPHIWHFRELLTEFRGFLKLYQPFVGLLSARIVFITGAVGDQFSSARIRRKGVVIHDGIPIRDLEATAPEGSEGLLTITTIGLLAPYKGQTVLLRALAMVASDGIDFKAYIVGDVYGDRHEYRNELNSLANELKLQDKVEFTGFKENVQPYLERCNIFVMPSTRGEGLGIVMLEAMAAGRAVIATSGGGVGEVIDDGQNGLLVRPGDVSGLARAIVRLVDNHAERQRLALAGRETVSARFSEEAMVGSVLELLQEVLEDQ